MRNLFVVLLLAACESTPPPIVLSGPAAKVTLTPSPLRLQIDDLSGKTLLASAAGHLVSSTVDRPSYLPQVTPGWDGYVANEDPWTYAHTKSVLARDAQHATLALVDGDRELTLDVATTDTGVTISTTQTAGDANEISIGFSMPTDEHFFGLGERFASIDHRGLALYAWAEEGGIGGGESAATGATDGYPMPNGPSMTYFPVPYHWSTSGYAMHANTTRRTVMHMGDEAPDAWRVSVNGTSLPLVVYTTDDPLVALDEFTAATGRPVVPSDWMWGPWRRIDRGAMVDGTDEYKLMRDRKIPITTIEDALHFLPHLSFLGETDQVAAWTASVHAAGYKVLAYNNPYVSQSDENAAQDAAFGNAHHYFEQSPDGTPASVYFISGKLQTVSTIDLTNPDAVYWFQTLLQRTLDFGYDGWMHDFGEYVKRDSHLHDGRLGDEVHNDFPRMSAKAAWELLDKKRPGDFAFHVRSGYTGSQAFTPMVWGGDAEATFDETQGLPSVLRGGVNLGMSGVPYWGSDMTGFKCLTDAPNDKEIFFRWVEFGAVSPVMREENACSNPVKTKTKWSLWNDDDTQTMYRAMASLHTRLAPYLRSLALVAHQKGTPIMIHPVLLFPHEPDAWAVQDSYFFGPSLYAAPVVRRGVTSRTVWLPPGQYLEWTDGSVHTGPGNVTVPAPLDRLPLFLVADRLVPMLDPAVQSLVASTDSTVTEQTVSDRLDVIGALSATGTATFTLADGTVLTATSGGAGDDSTTAAASVDALATCDSCSLVDMFGQAVRVRATSPLATTSSLLIHGLTLTAKGPSVRRIRWDIRLLP